MNLKQHNPMHPGEFIKRVYLVPFGIGSNELADKLQMSKGSVSRLLNAKAGLSPAMALKLAKVLGRSPESWLQMQDNYDLWQVEQQLDLSIFQPIDFSALQAV